jgi:hypothetical protein
MSEDGSFVVGWETSQHGILDGSTDVAFRNFAANGTASSAERVRKEAGDQHYISLDPSGAAARWDSLRGVMANLFGQAS